MATQSKKAKIRKKLIETYEFTTNKKIEVRVYENRIEIESNGNGNFFTKCLTGTVVIYLKHLTAIEFKLQNETTGHIEFLTQGFNHVYSAMNKVLTDNVILFSDKEMEQAKNLIDLINELVE